MQREEALTHTLSQTTFDHVQTMRNPGLRRVHYISRYRFPEGSPGLFAVVLVFCILAFIFVGIIFCLTYW